nr:divalent-cation tolerance protein CutA [Saprospiraceae bacterium]
MEIEKMIICYVPFPDEAQALKISEKMIKMGLAACSNIAPVKSCFFWQGEFDRDAEVVAILKTTRALESNLRQQLEMNHPYDVPCVISWEVNVNQAYKEWVKSNTKS